MAYSGEIWGLLELYGLGFWVGSSGLGLFAYIARTHERLRMDELRTELSRGKDNSFDLHMGLRHTWR